MIKVVDRGDGPPLLLLHGLGGSGRNWEANRPALADRHRVLVPDLPGFGESAPFAGRVTIDRYVDTVVELLDRHEVERATVAGNSMGGLFAIELAVRYPDRVAAAVLVNSGGIPLTSLHDRLVAIPRTRAINHLLRLRLAHRAVMASPWVRRLIAARIVHDPASVPAPLLTAALQGLGAPGFAAAFDAGLGYDARVRAPLVACPTLVLWGREDRLLPAAMGEQLERLIPDARLEVWEATGHCPMLEHPARFDALITDFAHQHHPEGIVRHG